MSCVSLRVRRARFDRAAHAKEKIMPEKYGTIPLRYLLLSYLYLGGRVHFLLPNKLQVVSCAAKEKIMPEKNGTIPLRYLLLVERCVLKTDTNERIKSEQFK